MPPRNRVAQLYPRALGSSYIASCDSHGYGGDILTLPLPGGPGPRIYIYIYISLRNRAVQSNVKVTLGPTVSQSVCLGVEHPCGTGDQTLIPVWKLRSCFCGALWQENGSAICSAIIQWSELHRTHNLTLLSHLRLPGTGWPSYIRRHWVKRFQDIIIFIMLKHAKRKHRL
jgi:hypothetical protein